MEKDNASNEELIELIKTGFDHVGEEFSSLRAEFKVDLSSLRTELKNEISSLRTELKSEISSVRTELKNDISMVRNDLSSEASSIRTEISALRSEVREGFLKTNDKVDLLAVKLQEKNIITEADAKEVMAISPLTLA